MDDDCEKEERINKQIDEIKIMLRSSKTISDYDLILKKFNIKIKKNNKLSSSLYVKKDVKIKIINMAINEPLDIFDYDNYIKGK
jgi:hypothetical protein